METLQMEKEVKKGFWRYADVAEYLQLSENTLRHFVMNRKIPYKKFGRSVRFLKSDIDAWAEEQSHEAK